MKDYRGNTNSLNEVPTKKKIVMPEAAIIEEGKEEEPKPIKRLNKMVKTNDPSSVVAKEPNDNPYDNDEAILSYYNSLEELFNERENKIDQDIKNINNEIDKEIERQIALAREYEGGIPKEKELLDRYSKMNIDTSIQRKKIADLNNKIDSEIKKKTKYRDVIENVNIPNNGISFLYYLVIFIFMIDSNLILSCFNGIVSGGWQVNVLVYSAGIGIPLLFVLGSIVSQRRISKKIGKYYILPLILLICPLIYEEFKVVILKNDKLAELFSQSITPETLGNIRTATTALWSIFFILFIFAIIFRNKLKKNYILIPCALILIIINAIFITILF